MPMKKHKPEQIVALLRQMEVEMANGKSTPQVCSLPASIGKLDYLAYYTISCMYAEVYANYVLYPNRPVPGQRFRQIVVAELERFEVRIFGGDVVQNNPQFAVNNPDAELYVHEDLKAALEGANREHGPSVQDGWTPY